MINVFIGKSPPSSLLALQVGFESVLVSWEGKHPDYGYRVTVGEVSSETEKTSLLLTVRAGTYNVEVIALFFPVASEPATTTVIVRGK